MEEKVKIRCAWCGSSDNEDLNVIYPSYGDLDISEDRLEVEINIECSNCWRETTLVYKLDRYFCKKGR